MKPSPNRRPLSRRLALAWLLCLLLALPLPAAALSALDQEPDTASAWWLEVKDDWDEAWQRAWSRETRDADTADAGWAGADEEESEWEGNRAPDDDGLVHFRYADEGYEAVALTGDWLAWDRLPMDYLAEERCWALSVALAPGRHHYRFVVRDEEGEWEAIDPANTQAQRLDDDGGWVSVLVTGDVERGQWRHERASWRRLRAELGHHEEGDELPLAYQRVDGLLLGFRPEHVAESDFEPSAQGLIAYGFASERWSLGLTLLQPLVPGQRFWLRLEGASGTAFAPRTGVSDLENTLAAAFFREDYRDYYRREGAAISLVALAPAWLRLEAGLRSEDHEFMRNTATWSARSGRFRPNLPIDEGTLRSLYGSLRLGTPLNHLVLAWERAGEDVLGGDFDYSLAEASLRSRLPLGEAQHLDLRVTGASNLRGALPRQRRFLLGGLGSVRGYDYQSLLVAPAADPAAPYGGERMLLANLEYRIGVFPELDLYGLYDAGMAWADRDAEMDLADLKDSAGIGLGSAEAGLRLNVMRTLDGSDETVLELRLERAF